MAPGARNGLATGVAARKSCKSPKIDIAGDHASTFTESNGSIDSLGGRATGAAGAHKQYRWGKVDNTGRTTFAAKVDVNNFWGES